MPLDITPPNDPAWLSFDVDAIGNGYLVKAAARPSPNDPLAQRSKGPPFYVRDLTDAPEAVAHIIAEIAAHEEARRDALAGISREPRES